MTIHVFQQLIHECTVTNILTLCLRIKTLLVELGETLLLEKQFTNRKLLESTICVHTSLICVAYTDNTLLKNA